jgi:hypothetical protein
VNVFRYNTEDSIETYFPVGFSSMFFHPDGQFCDVTQHIISGSLVQGAHFSGDL